MTENLITIMILGAIACIDLLIYIFVPSKRKFAAIFARLFIGSVFIFSGFVKAVDPIGVSYKMHDYLTAFGLHWMLPASEVFAVLLNLAEFIIGFIILFGVYMRLFAWGTLLFMIFFTPLTLYLAINNPVSDCGCFGDFLVMSNWETFYKNIVFITFALIVFSYRTRYYDRMIPKWAKNFIVFLGLFIGVGIQLYALRYDAIIDFRPWKVGNNIAEQVVPTMEESEIKLVYKNNTTGQEEVYASADLPYDDSIKMANLTFVDQRKTVIKPYKEAPIHDFIISNKEGDNLTEEIISIPNFHFIIVAYDITKANKKSFESLKDFAKGCTKDSISILCLSGSTPNEIETFTKETKLNFPVFSTDATALKTIIRSNPGILLLKNGYVVDKWAHRKMISYETFKSNLKKYQDSYNEFLSKKPTE